jgi:L-ascorbate metabolism protein UlaG (beta-lactamase superfamily)
MKFRSFFAGAFASVLFLAGTAFAAPTTVVWHGHAAFEVRTPKGAVLFIDPWLTNPQNPAAAGGKDPIASIQKADYILVTHGHFDHTGDAAKLAKKTGAKLVASFELGTNMGRLQDYPTTQFGFDTLCEPGGELKIANGEVTVACEPAVHASGMDTKPPQPVAYGGAPMSFIIKIEDGPTIYHTGDTAYFDEMKDIGEKWHPDLAFINIGGHFGMEPDDAAKAAEAVKAGTVVPMHFKTFPVLTQDAGPFFAALNAKRIKYREMKPGESITVEVTEKKSK